MTASESERKVRAQIRKAMNAYMDAPSPAKWDKVQRLDAQLRAITADTAARFGFAPAAASH